MRDTQGSKVMTTTDEIPVRERLLEKMKDVGLSPQQQMIISGYVGRILIQEIDKWVGKERTRTVKLVEDTPKLNLKIDDVLSEAAENGCIVNHHNLVSYAMIRAVDEFKNKLLASLTRTEKDDDTRKDFEVGKKGANISSSPVKKTGLPQSPSEMRDKPECECDKYNRSLYEIRNDIHHPSCPKSKGGKR